MTGARFATANITISERERKKDEHRDDLADHARLAVIPAYSGLEPGRVGIDKQLVRL